jgi:hypothetical protein
MGIEKQKQLPRNHKMWEERCAKGLSMESSGQTSAFVAKQLGYANTERWQASKRRYLKLKSSYPVMPLDFSFRNILTEIGAKALSAFSPKERSTNKVLAILELLAEESEQ